MVVRSKLNAFMIKINLIILLIISAFSILSSQAGIEYREGIVICKMNHQTHDLKVFLGKSFQKNAHNLPLIGDDDEVDGTLRFTPFIPFQIGQRYLAFCDVNKLEFQIPVPDGYAKPQVVKIYPNTNILPANLLKFHVKFSRPMSRIGYRNIDLLDEAGQTIDRAILKEIPELWNEDYTLLTIWIEPGRIKRGLGPNVELGPVLERNSKYSLCISEHFRDENGIEMGQKYVKKFVAGDADRSKLNIDEVVVNYDPGIDQVKLKFAEPIDISSSISNLKITDLNNEMISGFWQLSEGDMEVIFTPDSTLKAGHYKLVLNSVIEDLAGNNFNRNFDHEIDEKLDTESKDYFSLSFKVE